MDACVFKSRAGELEGDEGIGAVAVDAEGSDFQWDGGADDGVDDFLVGDFEGLEGCFVGVFDDGVWFRAGAEVSVFLVATVDETFGTNFQIEFGGGVGECAFGWAVEDGVGL